LFGGRVNPVQQRVFDQLPFMLPDVVVDQIIGQEEVVIKPLGKILNVVPGFSGATITGDGRIALVLDMPSLMNTYASGCSVH